MVGHEQTRGSQAPLYACIYLRPADLLCGLLYDAAVCHDCELAKTPLRDHQWQHDGAAEGLDPRTLAPSLVICADWYRADRLETLFCELTMT